MNRPTILCACTFAATGLLMAAVSAVAVVTASPAANLAAGTVMPVAQQNELVKRYCAVCHTDASRNGGLSLEHFDAARPDPGDAAMIVSKMKSNAFGAAGIPPPDKSTQAAVIAALSGAAAGANEWTVGQRAHANSTAPIVTVSVVQGVTSTANQGEPDLYRLTLTCRGDAREGEMQLAWSPKVPSNGRVMSVAADGQAPVTYKVEGTEKMGNGTGGSSGPGSIILKAMPLPARTLTISNLFPDQTVVFPFSKLTSAARQALSTCFVGS
jgi:hypothetical protein